MKCNKIANASLALIMFLGIILPIFIPTSLVRAANEVLDPATTKTFTPVEPINFITTDGADDTIKITNLPVNTIPGAKTTVEFWMYWNGTNFVKPFGWYIYNLYFANGYFGFNQADGSVLGIPSAELKNKWVHVAAVFTNGVPTADTNELYINGEKQSISLFLTQQTESKSVTPMAVISGWGHDSKYKFAGKLAEVRIWNYARTAEDIQSDMNRSLSGDEAGLIGAWNPDSLTTGIVYDVTKRNNGVATGFAAPLFNLQITEKTDQKMVLTWDKIANAETYVLKRNNSIIYQGADSTFTDTGLSPFTDYTYTLIARNSNGETNEAKIIDKTNKSVLPTPANIATTATNSSITLDWDDVAGATTYELQRDGVSIYSGSESKFIDSTGLTAATTYTYTLVAKSSTGESSPASVQVKTADPAPATPANLTGTATTTSIMLSWNAADSAESYELKRDGQVVYSGNELTYTDTGLKESTSYTYTLVAKNGTGESSPASVQVKTADPMPADPTPTDPTPTTPTPATPATPANLTGTATTTSIKLSWNAADNAESYELKRDGQVVYSGNDLTYTDTGLTSSTSYTYTLVAKNGTGESNPASVQVKTADPMPADPTPTDPMPTDPTPTTPAPATPATPANLTGTATTTSIKLSWNAADNAESYELKRDGQEVYTGSDLSYTDTGLTASTSYTYTLVAKNGTGESSPVSVQVKTADPTPQSRRHPSPATPTNLTGTATTTSIKLSWNAADNAENYELKRDGQLVYSGNELTYTDTGLTASTSYTYTLVAKNGTRESSPASVQVKTADPAPTTPPTTPPPSIPVTPPPTAPINFVGTSNERSILLIWAPVVQAVSYELKRDGVIIYSGVDTSFNDIGLERSTTYVYSLVAKNNAGESAPQVIQIATKSHNLESPKFMKKQVKSTSVILTWKKVVNADTYELLRDGKSIYKGKLTWFTDKRLTPSKTYTYTLVAWSRNDSSQSSVILVTNPNSPDKIKTKDITASKIKVVWTANGNSNETEYRVTTNNGYDSGWMTDLEHTLTNLSANKRYKISITARNKAGVVSNSGTINTKTKKK
ncbi:fibronectin type III domain-containing protein [Paenibacillus sp. Aloe-11]|uniref:fibronectin type III domain-containing protein n=1 Tax=Paenibacillus sp. Aloe-11 TaxID=1050222 RepID=UPI00024F07F7|nr:LamG-like jellyroll fold domain-containing protein [Paenibacillus sp. Aloe-11]EHS56180.1 DNA/RNA non-specific endonuclease [Paenibacillus sp. Aloe-11]